METLNLVIERHYEPHIEASQNLTWDVNKLERLLRLKRKPKDEAMYIDDIQRLVTEIEMLKLVLCLVNRNSSSS